MRASSLTRLTQLDFGFCLPLHRPAHESEDPLLRVISFNLRKNAAVGELTQLIERYAPDALCLQERDTDDLPTDVAGLTLADATKRNRLGLAIYFRPDRFTAVATETYALKKSLHDRVLAPAHERLIGSRLIDKEAHRELVVASFHAAPLTALNSLRRNQIRAAHFALHGLGEGLPSLMVGDYNYPLFKNNLTTHVNKNGYDLTLSDRMTYTRYKFFKGHFDFATSAGLDIKGVETLGTVDSDHKPILVTADYPADTDSQPGGR